MAALGLIAQHPGSTGYDLMRRFDISLANVWPATQSQLYGELNRLAADGLIEVAATGPRGRKEYLATQSGCVALRQWLVSMPIEEMRNPFLLRVFLLSELGREGARPWLEQAGGHTEEALERLQRLDAEVDWGADDSDLVGRIVLEWGLRLCRMQLEWLDWAEQQLGAGATATTLTGTRSAPAARVGRPAARRSVGAH